MKLHHLPIVLSSALAISQLSACVAPEAPPAPADRRIPGSNDTGRTGDSTSRLPISLSERELRSYNLDTASLSYKFSYMTVVREGAIVFTNEVAKIEIDKLPSGQTGDLKLDVLESGVVKLSGVLPAQKLVPGANQLRLVLKPVGIPGTADLVLSINIEGSTPNPTPTPSPQTTPNPTPQPTPAPGRLTYTRDIKAILDRACAECHTPGARSPNLASFPFSTVSEAQNAAIVDRIIAVSSGANRTMPPAPRDPLTAAEVETLTRWKNTGMAR